MKKLSDPVLKFSAEWVQDRMILHKAKFDNTRRWWRTYFKLRAIFYKTLGWHNLRQEVIKKYGGLCANCGKSGLEAHHKKSIFTHPQLMLEKKNLVYWCKRCHREFHRIERKQRGRLS